MHLGIVDHRLAKILPHQPIKLAGFNRQNLAQRRRLIPAGPKTVRTAEHDQAGAFIDSLHQLAQVFRRNAAESRSPRM